MTRNLSILPFLAALTACAPAARDSEAPQVIDEGKGDNFYSSVAAEFTVSGSLPVAMSAEEYANKTKRLELAQRRITAFGLYLTAYITDKEPDFFNATYGGFHGMVRNRSADGLKFSGTPATGVTVSFSMDLAGPKDMLRKIAEAQGKPLTGANIAFDVEMLKDATMDPDNVPWEQIRSFDPTRCGCSTETVALTGHTLPASRNAYPEYAAAFADGVFDITLFQGHDYNAKRSDLKNAKLYFDWLREQGYEAPVAEFEQLTSTSGPLTRTIKAGGKDVRIEVRIFHSDMFIQDRAGQHALALSELTTRDVFFYNGHAGPYYGFYLDSAQQAQVTPEELEQAPFTDKKQIFIANGCQTYSQYADNLYDNPRKSEDNLDVITAVNFSYYAGTREFLGKLLETDAHGNHKPATFYDLINTYNTSPSAALPTFPSGALSFYGAMGIDGNPLLHPYASIKNIGKACNDGYDCGDIYGNRCVIRASGDKVCGAVALGPERCPVGTQYKALVEHGTITQHVCVN